MYAVEYKKNVRCELNQNWICGRRVCVHRFEDLLIIKIIFARYEAGVSNFCELETNLDSQGYTENSYLKKEKKKGYYTDWTFSFKFSASFYA